MPPSEKRRSSGIKVEMLTPAWRISYRTTLRNEIATLPNVQIFAGYISLIQISENKALINSIPEGSEWFFTWGWWRALRGCWSCWRGSRARRRWTFGLNALRGTRLEVNRRPWKVNEYKRLKWSDLSEEQLYTICNCIQKNNATTQSIHCVRTCLSVSDQRQD